MAKVTSSKKSASGSKPAARSDESRPAKKAFDYAAFFAENGLKYTEKDLVDVGGLTPIYSFENAYEEDWPPVFGLLVNRIEIEVDKANAIDNQRWRWFYVIEAEAPTKALSGTGDDRETIDIEPGDYILMPESGALKNRDRLKMAASDPDEVYRVFFRVEGGPVDLGKPGRNPMWPVESKLVGDSIPRKGRYVIANTARGRGSMEAGSNGAPGLPPGTVMNARGDVNPRLVG